MILLTYLLTYVCVTHTQSAGWALQELTHHVSILEWMVYNSDGDHAIYC